MNRRRSSAPTILALIFCFFWGSAFIANKINLRYAPPLWNLTIRCTIAGLILLAVASWRRIAFPRSFHAHLLQAVVGLFNTALYMLFTLWGLQQISAGTAAIIASTNPLILALVAPVALKERLTAGKLAGVMLGCTGISFVMMTRLGAHDSLAGMVWVATGVLSLILGTLLFKWYPPQEPLVVANGLQRLFSSLLLFVPAWLDAPPSVIVPTCPLHQIFSPATSKPSFILMGLWGIGNTMVIILRVSRAFRRRSTRWPMVAPFSRRRAADVVPRDPLQSGPRNQWLIIFLVRQFYMTIPTDSDEAARIDGASNWTIWWRILLPLSTPVLVAVTIFSFVAHWNDFLGQLIYLFTEETKTLALRLRAFVNPMDASWHISMAASRFLVVPTIIIFFGQRYFIKGVTMTGIAGR